MNQKKLNFNPILNKNKRFFLLFCKKSIIYWSVEMIFKKRIKFKNKIKEIPFTLRFFHTKRKI